MKEPVQDSGEANDAGQLQRSQEALLIERIVAGETHLFADLIRGHERSLYRAAWRYNRNASDVEDVVQEAVLKALGALPKFRGDAAFGTWLVQITLNEARLRLKRGRSHLFQSIDESATDDWVQPLTDQGETAEKALLRNELECKLESLIWGLPHTYRQVIVLRDLCHCPLEQIAEATNSNIGAVKTRLSRARAKLRAALRASSDSRLDIDRSLKPVFETIPIECARTLRILSDILDHQSQVDLLQSARAHFRRCPRCSAVVRGANTLVSLFCGLHEFTLADRLKENMRSALYSALHRT